MVRVGLKMSMKVIVKIMVRGSFTINSSIDRKEYCTSLTSAVILEIVSPLRFSEK